MKKYTLLIINNCLQKISNLKAESIEHIKCIYYFYRLFFFLFS